MLGVVFPSLVSWGLAAVAHVAFGAAVRGGVVLLVAWGVTAAWSGVSAARRHFVWTLACGLALLMPLLQGVAPTWWVEVPVGQAEGDVSAGTSAVVPPFVLRALLAHGALRPAAHMRGGPDVPAMVAATPIPLLLTIWLTGSLVVAVGVLRSRRRVSQLLGETIDCDTVHVLDASRDARAVLGLPHAVPIRYHADAMPMVCRVRSPVIVLPIAAAGWARARLFDVLLHELAHIARRDMWTQAVATLTCVAYWFNPLVWIAARALRAEREVACDDRVLDAGARPTQYATHLLDLVHTFHAPAAAPVAALAFARPAQLRARLLSIVDPRRPRAGVTARYAAVGVVVAATVVYPLVALTPARGHSQSLNLETTTMQRRTMTALLGAMLGAATPAVGRAQVTDTIEAPTIPGTWVSPDLPDSTHGARVPVTSTDTVSITSVTDLLGSRVPGVTVQRNSATSGDPAWVRLRRASDTTGNEPIVIVDGIRVNADSAVPPKDRKGAAPSPLDQIDPSSIETIEAFKGPSATKRYGQGADKGVIVITTKKGKSPATDTMPRK